MIRHILSLLVVAFCAAPFGIATRVLLNDFIHDKRANKRERKESQLWLDGKLMNRDWNLNTAWLYDKPQAALWQLGPAYDNHHRCMICNYIYNTATAAQWKVGYSCLKSMEVFVIGYCDDHYAYLQPEIDAGRVQCYCGEEAGEVHDFEEIMVDEV